MSIKIVDATAEGNNNPLLSLLKESNVIEPFASNNEKLQLMVLDQNTFTAANAAVLGQARLFLGSGKPLTVLNPGKEQEELIRSICHVSSGSDNVSSWTIIPAKSPANCPKWIFLKQHEITLLNASSIETCQSKSIKQNQSESINTRSIPVTPGAGTVRLEDVKNQLIQNHYKEILNALQGELAAQQDSASYPSGLLAVTLHDVENYSYIILGIYDDWKNAPQQSVTLTETTEIIVFLNDQAGNAGPYQQVAFNQRVVFGCGGPGFYSAETKGWYNMNCALSQSTSDTDMTINNASPTSPNNETTITSTTDFSIGFSGISASGSYDYSKSTSETITDWTVIQNNNSGNQASWFYYQQNPFDSSNPGSVSIFNGAVTNYGNNLEYWYAADVSELSRSSIIIAPQTAWSNQVAQSELSFSSYVQACWGTTCVANPSSGSVCAVLTHLPKFNLGFSFANLPTNSSAYTSIDPSTFNNYVSAIYTGGLTIYANITNNTGHKVYVYEFLSGTNQFINLFDSSGNIVVIDSSSGSNTYNYTGAATDLAFINDSLECVAIISISIAGSQAAPVEIGLDAEMNYAPASIFPSNSDSSYQYLAPGTVFASTTGPSVYLAQIVNCSNDNANCYIFDSSGASQANPISPMSVISCQLNLGNYITACKSSSDSSTHDDLGIYEITSVSGNINVYISTDSSVQPSGN